MKFDKKIKIVIKAYIKTIPYLLPATSGINTNPRTPKLIVSLTTYPERIKEVHNAIKSILTQSTKPDMVILWLAEEEFPQKENNLPNNLKKLIKKGLTIKYVKKNIKSYKKIIPALEEYPDDIIVTADDDLYYPKNWLKLLYNSYIQNPNAIHCHRAHQVKFDKNKNIMPYNNWIHCIKIQEDDKIYLPTSGAGILIPPHTLHSDITKEELFLRLSPYGDDLWIWAMIMLKHTKIIIVNNCINKLIYINPAREYGLINKTTLAQSNCSGGNDIQLKRIMEQYPKLLKKSEIS